MTATPAVRIARCPQCGASSRLDERNAFRPFCSERCKLLDLGAWFDGRHAIPVVESEPDGDDES
ncbi:DNA gyrase inhibitor YacG [Nevskia sp.]|uniref:DNA gyrase inhibitor YacG n=1 Tax=Nevskia sp. TaxID=1929292 RepID=UPI0025FB8A6D|nr:DNA gyrase inhibitor YacG [Nevskia sp.]